MNAVQPVTIRNAYYVKLGRGGKWAEDSLGNSLICIGWEELTIDDINNWQESEIRWKIEEARKQQGLHTTQAIVPMMQGH
jgi:hypothetical protein